MNEYDEEPTTAPTVAVKTSRRPRRKKIIGGIAALAILGIGIGIGVSAGGGGSADTVAPQPGTTAAQITGPTVTEEASETTVTVTEKAPPPSPVVQPKAKTITVSRAPQACADYITESQNYITNLGEVASLAGDGITAAAELDGDTLDQLTDKVTKINEENKPIADRMIAAATECLAATD